MSLFGCALPSSVRMVRPARTVPEGGFDNGLEPSSKRRRVEDADCDMMAFCVREPNVDGRRKNPVERLSALKTVTQNILSFVSERGNLRGVCRATREGVDMQEAQRILDLQSTWPQSHRFSSLPQIETGEQASAVLSAAKRVVISMLFHLPSRVKQTVANLSIGVTYERLFMNKVASSVAHSRLPRHVHWADQQIRLEAIEQDTSDMQD